MCSQGAKQIVTTIGEAEALLRSGTTVAACLAPSFPAEFHDIPHDRLIGMIEQLGFAFVAEVAFGADLVANRYRKLVEQGDHSGMIATSCPALVEYVERYQPDLVRRLVPVVSPMVATARALRRLHGPKLKVVFIGPCIAKKREAASEHIAGDVDVALTYVELRQMFREHGVTPDGAPPGKFAPPRARLGELFPISRGLLQAAGIHEDLIGANVLVSDGRHSFVEALRALATNNLQVGLLEVLCCTGCIMGPGISNDSSLYQRRARVSDYAREQMANFDKQAWERAVRQFDDLDLSRTYAVRDQRVFIYDEKEAVRQVLIRMGKDDPSDELNCGACGYDTCRQHALAIVKGLAESEMCLPYTIEQLRKALDEVAASRDKLADTRAALMQAEKLASMGQLAAGIAHEVNNPLGVVLLYAHLLMNEIQDPKLRNDAAMIVEQADRCKKIVSGLLHFARQNKVVLQPVDVFELVERSLKGSRWPENIELRIIRGCEDTVAEIDRDQIVQVLTNLVTNAIDAMPNGGRLEVEVGGDRESVILEVRDTGVGIPENIKANIFEPFFTTKQIGKGTGLGLAVTYGIVKMHKGHITVQSNADPAAGPTGSSFTVKLPRRGSQD